MSDTAHGPRDAPAPHVDPHDRLRDGHEVAQAPRDATAPHLDAHVRLRDVHEVAQAPRDSSATHLDPYATNAARPPHDAPDRRPTRYSATAHLDAHVHLWDVDDVALPWFRAELDLPRRVLAADLERADRTGVGAVAVQAANTLGEFTWLEAETATATRAMRLVGQYEPSADGWAGVLQPRLHHLAGVRLAATSARSDLSDVAGLDALAEGLAEHELVLEFLLRPDQLPTAAALTARHPALRTVLCHLGLGFAAPDAGWDRAIAEYASRPNAHAKVSGVIRRAAPDGAEDERVGRVVAHARRCFGDDRLLFGSDWPMSARVAPHETIVTLTARAWGEDAPDAHNLWGATAQRLYGF